MTTGRLLTSKARLFGALAVAIVSTVFIAAKNPSESVNPNKYRVGVCNSYDPSTDTFTWGATCYTLDPEGTCSRPYDCNAGQIPTD